MHLACQKMVLITLLAVCLVIPVAEPVIWATPNPFPTCSSIQPNVIFWKKIFTEYTSNSAVIHDSQEINRIYGVIDLVHSDRRGSRKINRKRIKRAKQYFKTIIKKLMRGEKPVGHEENRIATLFHPEAKSEDFRKAIRNIRSQTGLRDRFKEGLVRSGAYIDEIKRIFRREGVPEDLAYLPHVESSFNPKAISKSGAVGTWQFTRSTGKLFMKINDVLDERRDPIQSSRAAAKLLHRNYEKLKNWPMAITAYNHGISGMMRAKRSHGNYETVFNHYQSRLFGFASRNFYAEFLAAREIAGNYQVHFGDLKLDLPRKNNEVVLSEYVSLPELSRYLKCKLSDLRRLNPSLKQPVYLGKKYAPKGYALRLPAGGNKNWEHHFANLPDTITHEKQKRDRYYVVRRGDTAGKIAKHYRVKLDTLIAANQLGPKARIYINQKIKIPSQGTKLVN